MGNGESKSEYSQEGLKRFNENFDFMDKVEVDDFNVFRIYQEKLSGCLIAKTEDNFNITRDSKFLVQDILKAIPLNHPNLLRIVGYERTVHDGFCGINVSVSIYNEWHAHNLEREIKDRTNKRMRFDEEELRYLLKSLIDVNSYLQIMGFSHGDLRPKFIQLSKTGNIKVYAHFLLSEKANAFTKAWTGEPDTFLSPEQFHELGKTNKFPTFSEAKGDVFTVGMTLIQCGILRFPTGVYDEKEYILDYNSISDYLNEMLDFYSRSLIDFIVKLTKFDPYERKTFIELKDEYSEEELLLEGHSDSNKKFVRKWKTERTSAI